MDGKLYIVGTPIGNLEDITLRALRILKLADAVLCEDTRVTKKLLARYDIDTPTLSYHQHSKITKVDKILELLREGQMLALVTDAGTPGISDPGGELVARVRRELPDASVEVIPGPSALTAALSLSGTPATPFAFLGFPPQKKGRMSFFTQLSERPETVVLYESPHRILKTLAALSEMCSERQVTVLRELTKQFESVVAGAPEELCTHFENHPEEVRGEFVLVVAPAGK